MLGLTLSDIDDLPIAMVMGLPEATVTTIVETWMELRRQGSSDKDIFELIEIHRSVLFGDEKRSPPQNIAEYVKYRLSIEHPDAAISEPLFKHMVVEAMRFFVFSKSTE
jgi:hypothetical protein